MFNALIEKCRVALKEAEFLSRGITRGDTTHRLCMEALRAIDQYGKEALSRSGPADLVNYVLACVNNSAAHFSPLSLHDRKTYDAAVTWLETLRWKPMEGAPLHRPILLTDGKVAVAGQLGLSKPNDMLCMYPCGFNSFDLEWDFHVKDLIGWREIGELPPTRSEN